MLPVKTIEKSPLVSVIIPTYNRASLLKETLTSILNQSYQKIEILVLSDASTDNTAEVVQSFNDRRIFYYEFTVNQGLPAIVRNEGLRRSKGDFIAFCDDDDLWKPHKIEHQLKSFVTYPQLLATSAKPKYLTQSFSLFRLSDHFFKSKILSYDELLSHNIIINSSVMMKRSVLELVGFLDESPALKAMEDYEYWLRILKYRDNSIFRDEKKLILYRVHNEGISNLVVRNNVTKGEQLELLFNKYPPIDSRKTSELKKRIQSVTHSEQAITKYLKKELSLKDYLLDTKLSISIRLKLLLNDMMSSIFSIEQRNLR